MTTPNPYVAPRAAVADARDATQPVRILAVSGRIGRARYIAYTIGLPALLVALAGVTAGVMGETIGGIAAIAAWVGIVVLSLMLTIQRCHDFDTTGWLAILGLIPLVNLIFWFIPGTDGPNRFGAKTPPNSVLVLIVVWLFPALFIGGIVAAVAIPAYSDYVKRAQQR